MEALKKTIKQALVLLYSFRAYLSFVPFLLMVFMLSLYSVYFNVIWDYVHNDVPITEYKYPEWFLTLEMYANHFFDTSFSVLIVLTALSRDWNRISKISLSCLWMLWALNLFYIITETTINIYFPIFVILIYAMLVILTVRCLTRWQ